MEKRRNLLCGVVISWALLALPTGRVGGTSGSADGHKAKSALLEPERASLAEGTVRAKGYDANDVGALQLAAADNDVGVRHNALIVLAYKRGRDAAPTLMAALDDRLSFIRCTAAELLAALGDCRGLDRMRKDMLELAKPQQDGEPSKGEPMKDQVKGSARRQYDALEAAGVLARFGDSSGYELAARAALQSKYAATRSLAVIVLGNLCTTDRATLQARGCDPEAILLVVAESEARSSVLGTVADCALGKMTPESQIRILKAIERSPHSSGLADLQRLAIRNGLIRAKKQLEQEKQAARREE